MKISYNELLDTFWSGHNFNYPGAGQYRSIIFCHDEGQKELAEQSKEKQELKIGRIIDTEVIPYESFFIAEDYHQKYYTNLIYGLREEYRAIYPDFTDFLNSTAVARANGFAGGHGTAEDFKKALPGLGLSQEISSRLAKSMGLDDITELCPSGIDMDTQQ